MIWCDPGDRSRAEGPRMRDHSWIANALLNLSAYAELHGLMHTQRHLVAALAGALPEVSPAAKQPQRRIVRLDE